MNVFKGELESIQHSHTNHFILSFKILYVSLPITDNLIFTPIPFVPKKCGLSISFYECVQGRIRECPTPTYKPFHSLFQNSVCFSPYNWLSNWASLLDHSNWALVCGLEWDQKGINKTLVPMGLGLFCQLLISPKLPLIIFNTTI